METPLLKRIYGRLRHTLPSPEALFLVQSMEAQKLFVCRRHRIVEVFDASTSRFGPGIRENSFQTPTGMHRITEKIGAGAPAGRIFRERRDTGIDWDGHADGDNLILTRILRLEGLEPGINRGDGVDSCERCIYIHGTNREDLVGVPLTRGCLALRNRDMIRLFDMVVEGTLLYIDPPPLMVGRRPCRRVHFTGIFGTGISALAQYLRFQGIAVSGSDRLLGAADTVSMRQSLERLGCTITAQDGSGIGGNPDVVCISTAIEASNPDLAAAHARDVAVVHRSELLAAIIASKRTVAVAGTSGKSTVTAMIYEWLTACGKSPSLISGAPLIRLEQQGLVGNAFSGGSDLLIVEADESDGSVVQYSPEISVILNISKDHKEMDEIRGLFETLISKSAWTASNADDPLLAGLPANARFGLGDGASWRPEGEVCLPHSVKLFRGGMEYHLPHPGRHNLENLRAALCVCEHLGCEAEPLAGAVRRFAGVARRFAVHATAQGVLVVDDYAHNPVKIAAAVNTARGLAQRIVAVYQPHGFGPTRFLKDETIAAFRSLFRPPDSLYLLPIYYAGGTARKDIRSEDLIDGLAPVPFHARAVGGRDELLTRLKADAEDSDCVLVMGARDPSLTALVKNIIALFGGENP